MHQRLNNQLPTGTFRATLARTWLSCLIVFFTLLPSTAQAISPGKALGIPAVANLMGLIMAVNIAMANASKNPLSEELQTKVKVAVSMLPAGIIAVAAVFKTGKQLHNSDLPLIQAMLGGFVDVNAPDRYSKFFKKPDKSLIPKLGDQFPSNVRPANIDVAMNSSVSSTAKVETLAVASNGSPSNDVVSLKDRWVPNNTRPGADRTAGSSQVQTRGYGYDETIVKSMPEAGGGNGTLAGVGNVGGSGVSRGGGTATNGGYGYDDTIDKTKPEATTSSFLREVDNELTTIESRVSAFSAPVRVTAPPTSELQKEKDSFFKPKTGDVSEDDSDEDDSTYARKKLKKSVKAGTSRDVASKYRIKIKPKYWNLVPLTEVMSNFMIRSASAECQECEGGGGGGEGGSKAAEILMAIAMIIQAIAPMVVASIQAKADVAIAKINADTTLKTTQIQADTSKFLANTQKDVALRQADISKQISEQNNQSQSQRLGMQLAELRAARDDAREAEREKRAIEQQYNRERIDLANKQAADNLKLAKATLNANLTQAGLQSGAAAKNSSNGLSVAKISPSSGTVANAGGGSSGGLGGAGSALPGTGGIPGGAGSGLGASNGLSTRAFISPTTTRTSRGADQLLAMARGETDEDSDEAKKDPRHVYRGTKGRRQLARAASPTRRARSFVASNADATQVSKTLSLSMGAGSKPTQFNRISSRAIVSAGDFSDFRKQAKDQAGRAANDYWRGIGEPTSRAAVKSGGGNSNGGHSGRGAAPSGYRVPAEFAGAPGTVSLGSE